jgi:hypothetical protein
MFLLQEFVIKCHFSLNIDIFKSSHFQKEGKVSQVSRELSRGKVPLTTLLWIRVIPNFFVIFSEYSTVPI